MDIIAVYNAKGGSGKSTLTAQISGAYHAMGKTVGVVDMDEQRSIYAVLKDHESIQVFAGSPTSKPDVDVLIIDHPPGPVLPHEAARVVIVPFEADRFNVASTNTAKRLLGDKHQVVTVLNKFKGEHGASALEKSIAEQYSYDLLVRERAAYKSSVAEGLTIFCENFSGAKQPSLKQAKSEIEQIVKKIEELL
ncbi:hypothetical protein BCU68_16465 [Vibrio sp. 10N.286.49.B3]|uniref:ParA family protein n=1 Tax=unclassified Vibrio TaxID=2614977 RepID=UPI000CB77E65|nr:MULTISPECIES: ParA family protein [unclassified Vibrio]PMH40141.1 hypothetical protein BCU68_16465 [Vibrio sp. 10N.286.49.B3]PMO19998.1 hypothetical protein BCT17_21505 [Vibrio sp. 10N.222.54.F10]